MGLYHRRRLEMHHLRDVLDRRGDEADRQTHGRRPRTYTDPQKGWLEPRAIPPSLQPHLNYVQTTLTHLPTAYS